MVKKAVSILYFAKRLMISERRIVSLKDDKIDDIDMYHDYFLNYHLDDYFYKEEIVNASWYIKVGTARLSKDDYGDF